MVWQARRHGIVKASITPSTYTTSNKWRPGNRNPCSSDSVTQHMTCMYIWSQLVYTWSQQMGKQTMGVPCHSLPEISLYVRLLLEFYTASNPHCGGVDTTLCLHTEEVPLYIHITSESCKPAIKCSPWTIWKLVELLGLGQLPTLLSCVKCVNYTFVLHFGNHRRQVISWCWPSLLLTNLSLLIFKEPRHRPLN